MQTARKSVIAPSAIIEAAMPQEINPDVQQLLKAGAALTDGALERLLPGPEVQPHSIHRAMRHSTFAGGKRLRPILAIEAARLVLAVSREPDALDARAAAELGAALEMLHTYSLIHDDLPALDNDDLRRGQPTCHVVFGEATAILAGDALQTLAFQTIARLPVACSTRSFTSSAKSPTPSRPASAATLPGGLPPGMIGGQVMDLEGEGVKPTAELVERIHRAKTGALITVSVVAGGYLAAAPEDTIARLRTFGQKAGLAFQIVDDVLDVTQDSAQLGKTAGKDTASDKATWPAVFGLDQSLHDARRADRRRLRRAGALRPGRRPAQGARHLPDHPQELATYD